jgi:hypothetical protein
MQQRRLGGFERFCRLCIFQIAGVFVRLNQCMCLRLFVASN